MLNYYCRSTFQIFFIFIFTQWITFCTGQYFPYTYPTPTPLAVTQSGSNSTWMFADVSTNCISPYVGLTTSNSGWTNLLTFNNWNSSGNLDTYVAIRSAQFTWYSAESNCFGEPEARLYDRCGSWVGVAPNTTKTISTSIIRTFNWTLPQTNLAYWRYGVNVTLQYPLAPSPGAVTSCTISGSCAVFSLEIGTQVNPDGTDSSPCTPASPSPSPIPSASPASPSVTPSPLPTSGTPSVSRSPSITPSPSASPSRTATPSVTPSKTPSITPSISVSPSVTPSPSVSSSPGSSPTSSPTASTSPSKSPTASPSSTHNPSPSRTPTPFASNPSASSTSSPTPNSSGSGQSSQSSTPTSSAHPSKTKKKGGNSGVVIGAIVGAVVGVILLGGLAFLLVSKRKKRNSENSEKGSPGIAAVPLDDKRSSVNAPYADFPRDSQRNSTPATATARSSILTSNEIYIDDVKLKGLLGKGKFGEVYEGLWHGTTAVACKKLKKDDKEEFENEIMLLMKLNHPNVVRCLGIWSNPATGEIFMILELLRLGSLTNFLRSHEAQKKLAVADLIEMCVHAASGMVFLEQKNIVHRDLGARNLLVTETDGRYVVKISDFGLSRQVEENDAIYNSKEGVFPVKWSPPEVINFRKFTSKSDVWSFGITMWEIFELGKVPYPTWTNDEAVAQVMKGYRLPKPDTCPEDVYKLMLQCWSSNPDERPNFKAIHERLQDVLKSIKGEDDEMKYTANEDGEKNYTYNNNTRNDTYNNVSKKPEETYNNSARNDTYNS